MDSEKIEEFFREFYEKEILAAAKLGKKSITVDYDAFDRHCRTIAEKLLNDPEPMLADIEKAASDAIVLPEVEGAASFRVRFRNLPEHQMIRIRSLRSEHIGKFVCVDGIVKRAGEVKPKIDVAEFECECGNKISVKQTEELLRYPSGCDMCGSKRGFKMIDKKLFDSRWVVIEEPFENTSGEKPGQVSIYLKEDLTSPELQRKCDPGNRIKVTGIIREMALKTKGGARKVQSDIFMEANHVEPAEIEWEEVEISNKDVEAIKALAADPNVYSRIVASIAPSIYGMEDVKEAILLQMLGGVQQRLLDGTRVRGDIHILLLGDPAVAKSQLLKMVSQLIPRGKYVSGKGATGAGLTATVFRDEELMGGWVLEAGAMVLCHKGVIAIDEFDKMGRDDQIAMHEALEQQTISIAKASIIATLPAQVSVLAGANPKFSRFDVYRPLMEQTDIPDTLLSRFDLKFALRDVPDKDKDEKIASHILESRLNPELRKPEISQEFMRKYIAYVRQNSRPLMTKEALERIKNFYVTMRGMYKGEDTVAITLRQNEALLRLSEASAKVRLSPMVEQSDAERAIKIMKVSLQQFGYDYETGKIDIDRTEGTSSSQRSKIRILMDVIEALEKRIGKQIPKEDIIAEAEDHGLKGVDEMIQKMKSEGMLFEPKHNVIQKL